MWYFIIFIIGLVIGYYAEKLLKLWNDFFDNWDNV